MSAMDQMGFVTLDEIANAYATEMAAIEKDLDTNGIPADRRIITEWMDGFKLQMMKRARGNLQDYLKNNPHMRTEMREEREIKDTQEQYLTYKERNKINREKSFSGDV